MKKDDSFDDHYVPNSQNAHIDTSQFLRELEQKYDAVSNDKLDSEEYWSEIHQLIENKVNTSPDEPAEEQLICRYLSPSKFLLFASQFSVYFARADRFDDRRDSAIPEDYNFSVQTYYQGRKIVPIGWDDYANRMRSRWLVSCWTEITDHYDDHLLWHKYAGGDNGVGITFRYGALKKYLASRILDHELDTRLTSGYVAYDYPLRLAPFNKNRIFRNEKEVRFVTRTSLLESYPVDISDIKSDIGLRLSPEASQAHFNSVRDVWLRAGGEDRINIAGDI